MQRRPAASSSSSSSVLISTTPALPQPSAEWDYSNTERWGWIILVATWTVFVIGIGSCFDLWDWVWTSSAKVNEGASEAIPTSSSSLPIPGYYPALIVLTGVVAWIWVFVAWVGMKYFRHAKIS